MASFFQFFLYIFILSLLACSNSKHPGFIINTSGLIYKFYSLGEGDLPKQNDYIKINYWIQPYFNESITLPVFKGEKFYQLRAESGSGEVEDALRMLNSGDSAGFIFPAHKLFDFFNIDSVQAPPGEMLLNLKIIKVLSPKEQHQDSLDLKKFLNKIDNKEEQRLKKYLLEKGISEECFSDGIYFLPEKDGIGGEIREGMSVSVHYNAYFLNGEIFDNTYQSEKPFEFKIGAAYQLIPGLETGIKKMKNRGKAKIIIPSQLAFGEQGSSTGIIPPNTTLVYEVEILRVIYN